MKEIKIDNVHILFDEDKSFGAYTIDGELAGLIYDKEQFDELIERVCTSEA